MPSNSVTPLPGYPTTLFTAHVGGRRLVYHDSAPDGTRRPVLLLVHGLGSNLSLWTSTLGAFTGAYRVVAPDLPGFGLSGKNAVPGTMTFFADVLADFLDALGIRRARVVGVSMGAQIAATLALDASQRVERLVLVSPSGIERFTSDEAVAIKQMMSPEAIAATSAEQVAQNVEANFADYADAYDWLVEQRHALAERADFNAYAEVNARAVAGMLDAPLADRLAALSVPTLMLFGAGDLLIPNRFLHTGQTTADVAALARTSMPHATVEVVPHAGHLLMIERPDVFTRRVRTFLRA